MKISNVLKEEAILPTMASRNKAEILKELSSHLVSIFKIKETTDTLFKILESREELGSTGIGDGIAIPHGKVPSIDEELLIVGRSKDGIDFNAMDSKPVHLFFLLVGPENAASMHLKALAKLSRILSNPTLRNKLLNAESKNEMFTLLADEDSKYS
ncbi:MAG: PTS sugar transporter subunit IIA [Candidatus Schekmanbacteria bacterium]|nr:PTS sugar transporter subunit IIA [Candidatus Schekmanbacteria bacterium]